MSKKKGLIISQIILAVGIIGAVLIMTRPGSEFDIAENWFIFFIIIILPTLTSVGIITAGANSKDDKKDDKK